MCCYARGYIWGLANHFKGGDIKNSPPFYRSLIPSFVHFLTKYFQLILWHWNINFRTHFTIFGETADNFYIEICRNWTYIFDLNLD